MKGNELLFFFSAGRWQRPPSLQLTLGQAHLVVRHGRWGCGGARAKLFFFCGGKAREMRASENKSEARGRAHSKKKTRGARAASSTLYTHPPGVGTREASTKRYTQRRNRLSPRGGRRGGRSGSRRLLARRLQGLRWGTMRRVWPDASAHWHGPTASSAAEGAGARGKGVNLGAWGRAAESLAGGGGA